MKYFCYIVFFNLLAFCFAQTDVNIPNFLEETKVAGLNHIYSGEEDFIVGGGVTVFDCDNDGLPEVFLAGGEAKANLFLNKSYQGSSLVFEAINFPDIDRVTGSYVLDIDGDNHKDLVILRFGTNIILRGLGDCQFEAANDYWNIEGGNEWTTSFSAAWLGQDTLPTLVFGNYIDRTAESPFGNCSPNVVIRPDDNSSQIYSQPEELMPSYCPLSILFSDWNRSGKPSLRFSNDRQYYLTNKKRGGAEQLWKVSEAGEFKPYNQFDGWQKLQIFGMGIASADITNDGYLDYFLTNMADNKLRILEDSSSSKPIYGDSAYKRGANAHRPFIGDQSVPSTGWHAEFADVNNDSLHDLFIAKGNVSSMPDFALEDPNNLLLGLEDGNFQETAHHAGLLSFYKGRGGAVTDLNLDGLLDVIVVNRNVPAQLWRNVGLGNIEQVKPMGNWLMLDIQAEGNNTDGVGAWLEISLGDRTLVHEITVGGGHASHDAGWIHFGLGQIGLGQIGLEQDEVVDLKIIWPNGSENHWANISVNQMLIVSESGLINFKTKNLRNDF